MLSDPKQYFICILFYKIPKNREKKFINLRRTLENILNYGTTILDTSAQLNPDTHLIGITKFCKTEQVP